MSSILWWMGQNSITVLLMVPLVMLACRMFHRRPALQHLLWLVVLVKFVTPPIVLWSVSLAEMSQLIWKPPTSAGSINSSEPAEAMFSAFREQAVANLAESQVSLRKPTTWNDWLAPALWMISGVWLVGAVIYSATQIRRIAQHATLVRTGRAAPEPLVSGVRSVAQQLRVRPPTLLISWGIASPFVWCMGCVRLIWPETLSSETEVARSRGVIAHELAHVCRGDHWVAWLELVVGIVWWWNPLYWLVRRRLRESAEMACDALAISTSPEDRREYAELLLEHSAGFKTGMPAHVLAVSAGTPSSFERRLSMILSERVSGKVSWWGWLAALGLAIVAAPGWSVADQQPSGDDQGGAADLKVVDQNGDRKVRPESAIDKAEGEPDESDAAALFQQVRLFLSASDPQESPLADQQAPATETKDARQAIIELIEAGKLAEALARLEELRAKQTPRIADKKGDATKELEHAKTVVENARRRAVLILSQQAGDARAQVDFKRQLDKAIEQLESAVGRVKALIKVNAYETNYDQQLYNAELKALDVQMLELRQLQKLEAEHLSSSDRSELESSAAEQLLKAIQRQHAHKRGEDAAGDRHSPPTMPLDAKFPDKWKPALINDLPEACLKNLLKDDTLSLAYCTQCHGRAGSTNLGSLKKGLKPGSLSDEPAARLWKTGEPKATGPLAELKVDDRVYILDRNASVTAADSVTGKLYWKTLIADAGPGQPGGQWTLQQSKDGKLLVLTRIRKNEPIHQMHIFDRATGRLVKAARVLDNQAVDMKSPDAGADSESSQGNTYSRWFGRLGESTPKAEEGAGKETASESTKTPAGDDPARREFSEKAKAAQQSQKDKFRQELIELGRKLTESGESDAEVVQSLYEAALKRKPSEAESEFCLKYLTMMAKDRDVAIGNIVFQLTFARETQPKRPEPDAAPK